MLLTKEELPLVDMEFMNEVHFEDVELINAIFELIIGYDNNPKATKEQLNQTYQEWIDHTVNHFHGEEVMMVEKGFPAYPMHKGEHDRALVTMREIFAQWQSSENISILKIYFIEVLPQWLINHINTMDMVTARFFKTMT